MEMEIWRYVNMEILYQQADNFQFSIFQFFNLSTWRLGGGCIKKAKLMANNVFIIKNNCAYKRKFIYLQC